MKEVQDSFGIKYLNHQITPARVSPHHDHGDAIDAGPAVRNAVPSQGSIAVREPDNDLYNFKEFDARDLCRCDMLLLRISGTGTGVDGYPYHDGSIAEPGTNAEMHAQPRDIVKQKGQEEV